MGSKANSREPIFDNSQLQKIMNEMIRCSDVDDLLKILLNGSWHLMSDKQHCYGWVGKLNRVTNKIEIICTTPTHAPNLEVNEIAYGKGITAQALAERIVKNIPDVSKDPNYVEYWSKTKSEIAIPIMVLPFRHKNIGIQPLKSLSSKDLLLMILSQEGSREGKSSSECV